MPHRNPPADDLRRILADARTIAMVGASSTTSRPSHAIMKMLQEAGYRVVPVNPKEEEVLGEKAYGSLAEVPGPVDVVDVFRRPEDTPAIADEAVKIGAKVLWLQLGVANEDAAARAERGGLTVVMDRCIGATHHELGLPPRT